MLTNPSSQQTMIHPGMRRAHGSLPTPGMKPGFVPSRRSRLLFLIAGMLLLIAPLSGRADDGQSVSMLTYALKFGRIGLSGIAVLVGLNALRREKIRGASRGLLMFAAFFTCGALWSGAPLYGLLNKGLFVASCMAGVVIAIAIQSIDDIRRGLRTLVPFIAIGVVAVVIAGVTNPAAYVLRRLAPFGMNANAVGQTAGAMFILCASHIVLDRSKMRIVSLLLIAGLGWIIFETGSRGAVLMASAGSLLVLAGLARGTAQIIGMGAVATLLFSPALVLFGSELMSDGDVALSETGVAATAGWDEQSPQSRMRKEIMKDTRTTQWRNCLRAWEDNPAFGIGWFQTGGRGRSVMNMYLQILIETGTIGGIIFVAWLAYFFRRTTNIVGSVRNWPREFRLCAWLAIGCSWGLLLHGIAESSTVMGATINPLLLGFSVAMIDRLPEIYRRALGQSMAVPAQPQARPIPRPAM